MVTFIRAKRFSKNIKKFQGYQQDPRLFLASLSGVPQRLITLRRRFSNSRYYPTLKEKIFYFK